MDMGRVCSGFHFWIPRENQTNSVISWVAIGGGVPPRRYGRPVLPCDQGPSYSSVLPGELAIKLADDLWSGDSKRQWTTESH